MKKQKLKVMTILDIILIIMFIFATINSFGVYEYFYTITYLAIVIMLSFMLYNHFYEFINQPKSMQKCNCNNETKTILIKYFTDGIKPLNKKEIGDWIDLRSAETVHLKKGEFYLIPLGVGMKLPEGYEANIVPRSSTFKNYGIIQTNSFAVIDNTYCGDEDMWRIPVYATRDTVINKNDRICQFRINKNQPCVKFETVEKLESINRGGFGSTGKNN